MRLDSSGRLALLFAVAGLTAGGCAQETPLQACNIAEPTCQESVYFGVLRLRGDGWDPLEGLPPIRTLTVEQYRAELLADQPDPADEDPDAEPAPDPWGTALRLLGLVAPAQSAMQASVESQVDNVAAFYAPATRKVTVIDRGQARNDVADTILLAHELVHALQDRELPAGIGRLDTDRGFATRAFIEGEAVLYERLAAQEIRARTFSPEDWDNYYGAWLSGLRQSMPEQRSPFFAAPWFVYPLGGGALTDAWLEGGNAAVRRLSAEYPAYSVQYMSEASDMGRAAGVDLPLRCALPRAVGAFRGVGLDRFGAIQLYAFLTHAGLDEAVAWRLALGWRNDNLGIYFDKAQEQTLVVWRVRFNAPETAAEAADQVVVSLSSTRAPLVVTRVAEDELQIAGSDRPAWSAADEPELECREH